MNVGRSADVQRALLAQNAAVVQPDDDVWHHLHARGAQRGQRFLEIRNRPIATLRASTILCDVIVSRGVLSRTFLAD